MAGSSSRRPRATAPKTPLPKLARRGDGTGLRLKRGTGRGAENPEAPITGLPGSTPRPPPRTLFTFSSLATVPEVHSIGASGRSTTDGTAGGPLGLTSPGPLLGNRRLHSASRFGAGMSPNSSMRALQCMKTAGEFGGSKENSDGISHPSTRYISLIAATSSSSTLWPSRHPMMPNKPPTYPIIPPRSPKHPQDGLQRRPPDSTEILPYEGQISEHLRDVISEAMFPQIQDPSLTPHHRASLTGGFPSCHRNLE